MKRKARPVPQGQHSATAYLVVSDAAEALDFYKRAFGAKETMRIEHNGKVGHAQIKIGKSRLMVCDEHPEAGVLGPRAFGGSPVQIFLHVPNVDTFVGKAVAIGAKLQQQVDDNWSGDRSGRLEDPFGHVWHVATHRGDGTTGGTEQHTNRRAGA